MSLSPLTEIGRRTDRKPPFKYSALARVWFWKQDYKKAVELQKKAVANDTNPDLAKTLREYEKLAAGKPVPHDGRR